MYVCIFVYVHLFQLLLEKDTINKNNKQGEITDYYVDFHG
jgi:hypothetical protein